MNEPFPYLSALILLPLAGGVLLMLIPRRQAPFIKVFALILTLGEFALSLPLFLQFNEKTVQMQFVEQRQWFPEFGISYLPGIDGIEVLRRVKTEHPDVEVIVLTGHGSDEIKQRCMELGACAYLEKPVDIETLTQSMKEAYHRAREKKAK